MKTAKAHPSAYENIKSIIFKSAPVLARELGDAIAGRDGELEEIRLRKDSVSSYRIAGKDYMLLTRLDGYTLSQIFDVLTEGAVYAYRDSLKEGYVTVRGIRVGVVGNALSAGEISALVFRIPRSVVGFGSELYSAWRSLGMCGTLIISEPGGGKTTALRALAMHIGKGTYMRRVAVVDSRSEFLPSDYANSSVDIITGHSRASGIEIAVRTACPEVVVCDEIFGQEDTDALMGAVGAGVTVIATAHGTSLAEVRKRPFIDRLFALGVFSGVISIERLNGDFLYTARGVYDANGWCYTDTFRVPFDR